MHRIQHEGLKNIYDEATQCPSIRTWLRQIMAMTMLPPFAIPLTWNALRVPPESIVPNITTKLQSFADYVDGTWINGDFPPELWSHYSNLGPRTTNLAEGFHNGMNSRFGMPHPSLRTFLHWLQKCQFEVQCRHIQLAAGRAPKPQSTNGLD